jgi:hypothetical protein
VDSALCGIHRCVRWRSCRLLAPIGVVMERRMRR